MKTKQLMTWGAIAVGGYLAYRWYQKDKSKRKALPPPPPGNLSGARDQYSTPDAPRWYGYGRTQDDASQGNAYGAETSETSQALNPTPPDAVVDDVQEAPEGAAFMDDDEFTQDSSAF